MFIRILGAIIAITIANTASANSLSAGLLGFESSGDADTGQTLNLAAGMSYNLSGETETYLPLAFYYGSYTPPDNDDFGLGLQDDDTTDPGDTTGQTPSTDDFLDNLRATSGFGEQSLFAFRGGLGKKSFYPSGKFGIYPFFAFGGNLTYASRKITIGEESSSMTGLGIGVDMMPGARASLSNSLFVDISFNMTPDPIFRQVSSEGDSQSEFGIDLSMKRGFGSIVVELGYDFDGRGGIGEFSRPVTQEKRKQRRRRGNRRTASR